jgi:CheY-like chemotaxis protein
MLFDSVSRLFGQQVATLEGRDLGDSPRAALAAIRGAKVLLVEDNDLNQEVATELLRSAGLVVDVADNGKIAVEKVQSASYDIVLMDMQMPVMDGVTATRIIREMPHLTSLPIVAMTANAMQADREACRAAGMDDHVAKPIEPRELFLTLLKWVKPGEAREAETGKMPGLATDAAAGGTSEDWQVPRDIDGLDTELGLKRVLGKVPRYQSMLEKYVAGQSGTVTALREALAAGDRDTATRLAHTTKGVSGNIGATVVQQRADELETALQQGTPLEQTTHLVDTLAQHLQPLVAAIAAQLEQPPKQADGPAVDRAAAPAAIDEAQLAAVTQRLRKLLEDHFKWTGSQRARELLDNWAAARAKFVKVFPNEYKRALAEINAKKAAQAAKPVTA